MIPDTETKGSLCFLGALASLFHLFLIPDRPLQVSLFIPLSDGFPFVVKFLPLSQSDLHLGFSAPKIEFQRDQGQPFSLDFQHDSLDFMPVKQQLSDSGGVLLPGRRIFIGADMGLMKPYFPALDLGITILKIRPAQA